MKNYTYKWEDHEGNIVIFPYPQMVFQTDFDARRLLPNWIISVATHGFVFAGILEFELDKEGLPLVLHWDAEYSGSIGKACLIGGPKFDKMMEEAEKRPSVSGSKLRN